MAKTYRTTNNCFVEDLGEQGNWNSFLKITKQNDLQSQGAATLKKVRISYLHRDEAASATQSGIMFVASTNDTLSSTNAEANDDYIMASWGGRLDGGVATLNLYDYKIRDTVEDLGRKDGPIWLFARTTDLSTSDNIEVILSIESHGRWITTETL